jgi:GntR family transcriptional regulator/MocR family aminotransferase
VATGLHLDRDPALPLRVGLERALREAVRGGRLRPGERLPSSRELAADLGMARNTIADVYAHLVAEGYLVSARGAGTRVAATAGPAVSGPPAPEPDDVRYDLRPGRPDLGLFPQSAWLVATRRALNSGTAAALGYGDVRGPRPARTALAGYLARVRGVVADPDRIVLCSGYRQAVALLAAALRDQGRARVAVESPGLPEVAEMLSQAGLSAVDLPVDVDGVQVAGLDGLDVAAAVVTPAHQFPTGVPLSPSRRVGLLDWAARNDGVVLEDDYDGEFRYDRQPIGALQGLAPERVVYAGSASKTLAPGLRLGWLVVPGGLLDAVVEQKRLADRHSSTLDHLALAELITAGEYDRHVRRARLHYRRRRDELAAALDRPVLGIRAGLHVVLPLPSATAETETLVRLARAGVAVNGLARYGSAGSGLAIGYAAPPQHLWPSALAALMCELGPDVDNPGHQAGGLPGGRGATRNLHAVT